MTQNQFDDYIKIAKKNYKEMQQELNNQACINKLAYKAAIKILHEHIEPASKERKARNESYSLQRHLKNEIERFCDGKKGLTSEGAKVQFVADDTQVVFTIVVPKK